MSIHFLPIIALVVCILVSMIAISIHRNHGLVYLICGTGLMASMLWSFHQIGNAGFSDALFMFTPITPFLSLMILIVTGMLWVQLYQWLEDLDERKEEYYLLMLFATVGAMLMIASNHFASFFVSLELMSLSFVGLVAYSGKAINAQEAGIKYLVLSAVASACILMGIALLYLQYGTLSFTDLTLFSAATILPAWITVTAMILMLSLIHI